MKVSALLIGLIMVTGSQAFSQDKTSVDQSYSVSNYKHPNKAAYAKKHNLENTTTVGEIQVTENQNYKQSNSLVTTTKLGVVSNDDGQKEYPNYKHPQLNLNDQENSGDSQIAKERGKQKGTTPAKQQQGKN
jgi:hypothetical protein